MGDWSSVRIPSRGRARTDARAAVLSVRAVGGEQAEGSSTMTGDGAEVTFVERRDAVGVVALGEHEDRRVGESEVRSA